MNSIITQLLELFNLLKTNFHFALWMVLALWAVHYLNALIGYRLNYLGIFPRHLRGIIGIPFFSWLHADFNHLFFNSIPLLVLIDFILIGGWPNFIRITLIIVIVGGSAIWAFGRRAIHIGASCLVMGYLGYVLAHAYDNPSLVTALLAIICLYYFGTLLFSVFPTTEKVSWEGHLFGLFAGLVAAYFFS